MRRKVVLNQCGKEVPDLNVSAEQAAWKNSDNAGERMAQKDLNVSAEQAAWKVNLIRFLRLSPGI